MMDGVVDRAPAGLGQADVAGPVKHQQGCAANLVAQLAIGLNPVPGFADFLGQGVAMQARVVSDEFPQEHHLGLPDLTATIA